MGSPQEKLNKFQVGDRVKVNPAKGGHYTGFVCEIKPTRQYKNERVRVDGHGIYTGTRFYGGGTRANRIDVIEESPNVVWQ